MGIMKSLLFEFLDEAEDNENTVVAWIKPNEIVVIIPSEDHNINLFLSRFVQTSKYDLDGYPNLKDKALVSLEDITKAEEEGENEDVVTFL